MTGRLGGPSVRLQADGGRPAKAGRYICAVVMAIWLAQPVGAHKPVTSKYTYNEDVYPIVSRECGACHSPGGVAPMSLLTYDEARPWAESIRLELASGHMPPWFGDPGFAALRDAHKLSPRDLDVVLTWVTGGTPRGAASPGDAPKALNARGTWRRGRPAMTLQLPAAFTLPAGKTEDTQEFVLETARDRDRVVTAADLLPGNPAIVHDAIIFIRDAGDARETVLATWLPGSTPVSTGAGIGFLWRAGEQLGVRIHYRKTWKQENKPASDRSTVGLYLSNAPARDVRRFDLTAAGAVLEEDAQALAVVALRNPGAPPDVDVRIEAIRPDGTRVPVVGFGVRPGWDQRYWLARPIALPKGTRLDVKSTDAVFTALRISLDIVRPT